MKKEELQQMWKEMKDLKIGQTLYYPTKKGYYTIKRERKNKRLSP